MNEFFEQKKIEEKRDVLKFIMIIIFQKSTDQNDYKHLLLNELKKKSILITILEKKKKKIIIFEVQNLTIFFC